MSVRGELAGRRVRLTVLLGGGNSASAGDTCVSHGVGPVAVASCRYVPRDDLEECLEMVCQMRGHYLIRDSIL